MHTKTTWNLWMLVGLFVLGALLLAGCGGGGGGSSGSGAEQTLQFGSLITRVVGTLHPPVTSGGSGAVVTGVAGASVTGLTLVNTAPTLAQTRIAFTRRAGGLHQIYAMNPDGSGQTNLSNSPTTDDFEVAWSPDASKIAFARNAVDGISQIYAMNVDGSGQTNLSNSPTNDDREPAWSPDGSKIAFRRSAGGNRQIYVMNADGSAQTNLSNNPITADFNPAWSPDGSKIAFMRSPAGAPFQIYVMNADGSGQTNLSNSTMTDESPAWSPDGSKIAFAHLGDTFQIYVMNADGSGKTNLSNTTTNDESPAWSPFVKTRTLLGPGGSLGDAAAGFLFGQQDTAVTSVVAFDTASPDTRADAHVAAKNGTAFAPPTLVFSLTTSDSLKSLSYTNGFDAPARTIVPAAGATGAIVSFSGSSGIVTSVLPYTANRSTGSGLQSSREGSVLVYRAHFLGVWDGSGKNRAPNGASEVRIFAATGTLLAFK